MPQMQLPLFPDGVEHITAELAFEKKDGQVTYFNGHMPVFIHAEEDTATFRMITAQFYINGNAKQADISRAFGITLISVKRAVKRYRQRGPAGFYEELGESPCSGCETGLPSRPFAFRSATAFTPRFAPLRGHGITTARALRRAAASRHDPYANGLTASRMRSACCLRGSGTSAPAPLRQHARAYAYRGLRALASLSMARSGCRHPPESLAAGARRPPGLGRSRCRTPTGDHEFG